LLLGFLASFKKMFWLFILKSSDEIKMMETSEWVQRRNWYEQDQKVEFPTREVPRDAVLRNMSRDERNALVYLFGTGGILSRLQKTISAYGVFAVGTITYPTSYWVGLEKYLMEKDPTKLNYVKRRGQDIDLIITEEIFDGLEGDRKDNVVEIMHELLRKATRKGEFFYDFSEEARENGTQYLTVPEEYIEKEGQSVLRTKPIAWAGPNFRIKIRGCRWFHVSFDGKNIENKLRKERIANCYFSLLERHFGMVPAIDRVNLSPGFFDMRNEPTNIWLDEAASKIIKGGRDYRERRARCRRGECDEEQNDFEEDKIPF